MLVQLTGKDFRELSDYQQAYLRKNYAHSNTHILCLLDRAMATLKYAAIPESTKDRLWAAIGSSDITTLNLDSVMDLDLYIAKHTNYEDLKRVTDNAVIYIVPQEELEVEK